MRASETNTSDDKKKAPRRGASRVEATPLAVRAHRREPSLCAKRVNREGDSVDIKGQARGQRGWRRTCKEKEVRRRCHRVANTDTPTAVTWRLISFVTDC